MKGRLTATAVTLKACEGIQFGVFSLFRSTIAAALWAAALSINPAQARVARATTRLANVCLINFPSFLNAAAAGIN
jgi:hypothetical protein